jgi:intein/homing endonuclease
MANLTLTTTASLVEDLIFDVQQAVATADNVLDIISFVDTEIDKAEWGIDLNINQRAVLKAYYRLPLELEEESFLESLKYSDSPRTTWDKHAEDAAQYLVLEAGRRGSKCLKIDSLVHTALGYRYLYEILAESYSLPKSSSYIVSDNGLLDLQGINLAPGEVVAIKETVAIEGTAQTAKASNFYIKGISPTKVINTACDYEIEATAEHRIKILDASGSIVWRYFKDLATGDWACIHRSTSLFPVDYVECLPAESFKDNLYLNSVPVKQHTYPTHVTVSVGKLLGLLVGNGSWTKASRLELSLYETDLDYYKQILKENNLLQEVNQSFDRRSQHGFRLSIYSTILRSFYSNLGFVTDSTPSTKKVPWSIRQSPKNVQAAFLSNLFAANGCLGKGGRDVSLSTASKFLAQEVQLMLLNFGIVSRIQTQEIKGKDYYLVTLRGKRSLKIFATEITFGLPRKQIPLVAYLAATDRDGVDTERIPNQKIWLQRIRDSLPTNQGKQPGSHHAAGRNLGTDYAQGKSILRNLRLEFRAIVGNAIKENNPELLSSYRLDAVIQFAEEHAADLEAIAHFKYLRDCDYFYDPICVDLSVPGHEQYVAQGFTNHNTAVLSVICAYEFYKLCHIPNPQRHYGIGANTPITLLVLSTTAQQAKGTVFAQVSGLFKYVKYFKPLLNKKLVIIGAEEITYKAKQLSIISGNSKSSSQVGYSIITLIMDEVARMEGSDSEDGQSAALSMWSNLGASGISFGKDARRIAASSAWYEGDPMQKLYAFAETDPAYIGFRLATWQLNPKYDRNNPIVASAYNSDPRTAALEYEGIRSSPEASFFDPDQIIRCFRGDTYISTSFTQADTKTKLTLDKIVPAYYLSCGYLDPAIVKDSYTFAFGHREADSRGENIYYVDGCLVWEPDPLHKVSIVHVQECIKQVHSARPILSLGADHHNSAETVERLNRAGIRAKVYTASNPMQVAQYSFVRQLMQTNRLILPKAGLWRSKLQDELTRVQLIKGIKIDHPRDGSKDIADAVCGLCWLLEQTNASAPGAVQVVSTIPSGARLVSTSTARTSFAASRTAYKNTKLF